MSFSESHTNTHTLARTAAEETVIQGTPFFCSKLTSSSAKQRQPSLPQPSQLFAPSSCGTRPSSALALQALSGLRRDCLLV